MSPLTPTISPVYLTNLNFHTHKAEANPELPRLSDQGTPNLGTPGTRWAFRIQYIHSRIYPINAWSFYQVLDTVPRRWCADIDLPPKPSETWCLQGWDGGVAPEQRKMSEGNVDNDVLVGAGV